MSERHILSWPSGFLRALSETPANGESLCACLARPEHEYGDAAHSQIIFSLSRLRFDPTEARSGWRNIMELQRAIHRSERFNAASSPLMVDIDDFKQFNDSHGHPTGNQALVAVARALSATLRAVDTVARFGGEEFVLILPSTPNK